MMLRWAWGCVLICACGPSTSHFRIVEPSQKSFRVHFEQTEYDLPNGMRAMLLPDKTADLVEVDVRYEVGSRDDPPGKEGLAHLVEHLTFTARVGGTDRPSLLTRLRERALSVNAYTDQDYTHYTALARADRLEELLEIEAVRLTVGCKSLTPAVLEREREVVRNEGRQKPEHELLGKIYAALYPAGHPYAHAPFGSEAGLAAITLDDVCRFIDQYYVPSRAILVVAGRADADQMNGFVSRTVARVPKREPAPRRQVPPVAAAPHEVTLDADVDIPLVFAAWPAPRRFTDETDVVEEGMRMVLRGLAWDHGRGSGTDGW